jgi:hypothetical protein
MRKSPSRIIWSTRKQQRNSRHSPNSLHSRPETPLVPGHTLAASDPLAAATGGGSPIAEGDMGQWKMESAARAAGVARVDESPICDQGGDLASGWWRRPSPVMPWPAADAGLGQVVFGRNLDLI